MFKFAFGEEKTEETSTSSNASLSLTPPSLCSIDDLKRRAPRVSYSIDKFGIPRRDLYDVRFELMNMNELTEEEKLLLNGSEDVRKSVYEGGLKVWEGTNDLLEILSSSSFLQNDFKGGRIMELGCGAGIPSCFLFHYALKNSLTGLKFVFADYNSAVLKLLTMPNVVLTWLSGTGSTSFNSEENEVILSVDLINEMLNDLKKRNIEITFISGAWGKQFSELTQSSYDLVLASETIYSLDSIEAFTDVLCDSLKEKTGKGLVAAKRMYFGVGGGMVEFERILQSKNANYKTVLERGNVGRVVLEVTV